MMSIFSEAVDLPPDERSAFVARACGSDAELLREVLLLLMAHDDDANSLEAPTVKAASDAPDIGARLQAALGNEFRVERELAGGGMSRVFVAVETKLGRRVVVKVLPPELRAVMSPERFQRETRLAAALRHPHIVPLLAAGESADGLVYFTMPFIEGESLEQRLAREGRIPLADVVAIVHEVVTRWPTPMPTVWCTGTSNRRTSSSTAATLSSPTSAWRKRSRWPTASGIGSNTGRARVTHHPRSLMRVLCWARRPI